MNKNIIICILIIVLGIVGFVSYRIYDKLEHEKTMREIREAEIRYNQLEKQLDFLEGLQDTY